jgi:uncharacterized protein YdhG (YjbR/CyaY superfamily)
MATAIDDYIAGFPGEAQAALHAVRRALAAAIPDAEESISYRIPTFKLNGSYVFYFAGFKKHVSIYPLLSETDFEEEVAPYRSGRATVKFPLNAPMPLSLIAKIAAFMVAENKRRMAETSNVKAMT